MLTVREWRRVLSLGMMDGQSLSSLEVARVAARHLSQPSYSFVCMCALRWRQIPVAD